MPLTVLSRGAGSELGLCRRGDALWVTSPRDPNKPLIVFFWFTWAAPADTKTAYSWSPAESMGPVPRKRRNLSWLTWDLYCFSPQNSRQLVLNILWQRLKPGRLQMYWKQRRCSSHVSDVNRYIKNWPDFMDAKLTYGLRSHLILVWNHFG